MQPISVGIREAKTHFSKLLKNVKRGEEIIIIDRGKPVGKIVPLSNDSLSLTERIKELERSPELLTKRRSPFNFNLILC